MTISSLVIVCISHLVAVRSPNGGFAARISLQPGPLDRSSRPDRQKMRSFERDSPETKLHPAEPRMVPNRRNASRISHSIAMGSGDQWRLLIHSALIVIVPPQKSTLDDILFL